MKPLSEKLKELRKKEAFIHVNISAERAAGIGYAVAKVEAWLKEADEATRKSLPVNHTGNWIRTEMLGTTRTEGKK